MHNRIVPSRKLLFLFFITLLNKCSVPAPWIKITVRTLRCLYAWFLWITQDLQNHLIVYAMLSVITKKSQNVVYLKKKTVTFLAFNSSTLKMVYSPFEAYMLLYLRFLAKITYIDTMSDLVMDTTTPHLRN